MTYPIIIASLEYGSLSSLIGFIQGYFMTTVHKLISDKEVLRVPNNIPLFLLKHTILHTISFLN